MFANVVTELIIDLPHQIGKSNYRICARLSCNDRNFLPKTTLFQMQLLKLVSEKRHNN